MPDSGLNLGRLRAEEPIARDGRATPVRPNRRPETPGLQTRACALSGYFPVRPSSKGLALSSGATDPSSPRRPEVKGQSYGFRATFRAPVPFVFKWCTDYSSEDPQLEGAEFERRVIGRTRGTVTFEDLQTTKDGWVWSRNVVTLQPPNRWRARMEGNRRRWLAYYTLRALNDGRTELVFRGRRTPTALGAVNPPVRRFRIEMEATWKRFAKHLGADYRASLRGRRS